MRDFGLIGLAIMASAALAGCDSRIDDEPVPSPEVTVEERVVPPSTASTEGAPADGEEAPEEVLLEVEPEIDSAAPMDSAEPVDNGISIEDQLNGEAVTEESAE